MTRLLATCALICAALAASACGGGGGSTYTPPPVTPGGNPPVLCPDGSGDCMPTIPPAEGVTS